jgi:hypothetical protein
LRQHELSQQTEDTGDDVGIRAVREEDAARDILGRDGAGGALGSAAVTSVTAELVFGKAGITLLNRSLRSA